MVMISKRNHSLHCVNEILKYIDNLAFLAGAAHFLSTGSI